MHLKNWSLIYADGRTPALAPAYDLLSTISYIPDDSAALNYSRTRKMTGLTRDELRHLAAKARIPEKLVLDTAAETVARFRHAWDAEKANLPIDKRAAAAIDAHAPTIPLFRDGS